MMRRSAPPLALALLLGSPPMLGAQAALQGRVVHDSTGRPIAGVAVAIEGQKPSARTDETGRYLLAELSPGNRIVVFRAPRFQALRMRVVLVKGDTASLDARLLPEGVQLPTLEVTAEPKWPRGGGLESFEERRKLGIGRFIDSTVLRRSDNRHLDDLLRGYGELKIVAPPVCTSRNTRGDCVLDRRARFAISARLQTLDHCFLAIVLDGAVLFRGGDVRWESALDLNTFSPSQLEAMEVYTSGGEVPMEYGGNAASCGAILLWSRKR